MDSEPTNPLAKLAGRQQQKFLLLLNRDDFQRDIGQLRSKWAIPFDGLKTPQEHEVWWHKHNQNADDYELANQEANHQEVLEAKRRWLAKELSIRDYDNVRAGIKQRNPINAFAYDLDRIITRYRLSPRWQLAIQTYLFTNEPRYHGTVGITIKSTFGHAGDPDEISLVLDAHVTRQDLIDAWPSIKSHLDRLRHKGKEKTQPYDPQKLARNKLAYQLKQQGKTYAQIASILSAKYSAPYSYADIPTMVKNYKKLLGMN